MTNKEKNERNMLFSFAKYLAGNWLVVYKKTGYTYISAIEASNKQYTQTQVYKKFIKYYYGNV